jgi:LuxR family maltose regulon positive regulatory protein
MKSRIFHSEWTLPPESRAHLERPRVMTLLENAVKSPYVVITAGAGCGKTQAVYAFLRRYDASVAWIQLSERDNSATRFWENFSRTIELYSKRMGERMRELGFPGTDDQFAEVLTIPEDELSPNEKYVLVFDDFHLIEDARVLRFMKQTTQMPFPNITLILISRIYPDVNLVSLLSKGLVANITEDDLRFTEDEALRYFQLLNIPLSYQSVADIHHDTAGWAFALNLVGLSLKKAPSRERGARTAMKLNVHHMIENEVFLVISERLRRFLIRLSLIDHLSTDLVALLAKDETLVEEMKKISSFVRYDIYLNAYLIHQLFLDYLRQRQDALTEEEKRGVYLEAALWCEQNDYKADAVSYYHKAGEYGAIVRILRFLPLQLPFDRIQSFLDIFDGGPPELLEQIPAYHFQHTRLLISAGRFGEALAEIKARVEKYSALPASSFNNQVLCGAYLEWGVVSYLTLPDTDRCDFDFLMQKAAEYYRPDFNAETYAGAGVSLSAWASRVGTARKGAMEEYIETLTRAIPHISGILEGCMTGLDDLAQGELLFYKGNMKASSDFFHQALHKAKAHKQYEIQNRSLFNLMRVAAGQGNFERTRALFEELETQLDNGEYPLRFTSYDIVSAWYHALVDQPRLAADWLKSSFTRESAGPFISGFANLIRMKFFYAGKRYYELLSFIESDRNMNSVLFGRLEAKVLEAACYYQIKDAGAAMASLKEAYDMAESNELTVPFISLGKTMRTLTAAAMRDEHRGFPRPWLEMINRKAATFAKRRSLIIAEYKKAYNIGGGARLSARETEILNDLYHGLSRSEIAASRNLSINTVKMVINTVYTKLDADNLADAIRAALERKLI